MGALSQVLQPILRQVLDNVLNPQGSALGGGVQATAGWWPLIVDRYAHANGTILSPIAAYHVALDRNSAATVVDHEGIVRTVLPNELRFQGARRKQELSDVPNDYSGSTWSKVGAVVTNTTRIDFPAVNDNLTSSDGDRNEDFSNRTFTCLVRVTNGLFNGNGIQLELRSNSGTFVNASKQITGIGTWSVTITMPVGSNGCLARLSNTGSDGNWIDAEIISREEITGSITNAPQSELVLHNDSACSVSDIPVRYFDTTNGNTVDGNGVVTEAAGSAITPDGLLVEEESTNYELHSNDLTAWATGGSATIVDFNTATFSAANDRVTSTTPITGNNIGDVYTVTATLWVDSGTEQARVGVGESGVANHDSANFILTTTKQRFEFTTPEWTTTNNATARIVNGTDGSAKTIHVEGYQSERKAYSTSFIPTSGASATRLADNAQTSWPADLVNDFVLGLEFICNSANDSGNNYIFGTSDETRCSFNSLNRRPVYQTSAGSVTAASGDAIVYGNSYSHSYRKSATQGITLFQNDVNIKQDALITGDLNDGVTLVIGQRSITANTHLNGTLKTLRIRSGDLTDDEVING